MINWPKVQIFQRFPHLPNKEKQNNEELPNTLKIHPQQFLTKVNPLVKKSINNPTTLEFCLNTLKNKRRNKSFLKCFFP